MNFAAAFDGAKALAETEDRVCDAPCQKMSAMLGIAKVDIDTRNPLHR